MSASPLFVTEAYIASGLALGLLVFALGAALAIYQRRTLGLRQQLDDCRRQLGAGPADS
jgi:hypothetical protein